jgi:hypothetical protein
MNARTRNLNHTLREIGATLKIDDFRKATGARSMLEQLLGSVLWTIPERSIMVRLNKTTLHNIYEYDFHNDLS